jgi:hypothetical protein
VVAAASSPVKGCAVATAFARNSSDWSHGVKIMRILDTFDQLFAIFINSIKVTRCTMTIIHLDTTLRMRLPQVLQPNHLFFFLSERG